MLHFTIFYSTLSYHCNLLCSNILRNSRHLSKASLINLCPATNRINSKSNDHAKNSSLEAFACFSLLSIFVSAFTTINVLAQTIVSPCGLYGWQIARSPGGALYFVNGAGTPPLGNGSGRMEIGPDGDDFVILRTPNYAGTAHHP